MKRYTVTVDMYMYAEDDTDVRRESAHLVEKLKQMADEPSLLSVHETPFGTIGEAREVSINDSNCCDAPIIENTDLCSECKEHTGVGQ